MIGLMSWLMCLSLQHAKDLPSKQSFDSTCCLRSYEIQVTDKMIQLAAEALSRTGVSMHCSTQETVRRMAAMKIESVLFLSASFYFLFCI